VIAASSVVTLDPVAHEYRRADGVVVPGVTSILKAVGVAVDFDELRAMSARIGAAVDLKREIGHALHADAHAFDDDDLDWLTVDPRVEPYLRAWATFRENSGIRPATRERLVYSSVHGYAGTLDGIFRTPDDRLVLIDIKTGDPDHSGCQYQTAAYHAAYVAEHPGQAITERWGVQLIPDRRVPYSVRRYTDWRDFSTFCAFLTTYHCQAARRRTRTA
jgi:hypothetical protein